MVTSQRKDQWAVMTSLPKWLVTSKHILVICSIYVNPSTKCTLTMNIICHGSLIEGPIPISVKRY